MPIPPQFLPGYVSKSQTAAAAAVPATAPSAPKKFVPTKAASPAKTPPETPAQKAENAAVLARVLKANGIDSQTAAAIVSQFKSQDN